MYEENRKYDLTINDYESAKEYLKSIGEWDKIQSIFGTFSARKIIDEANRIKSNQIILTE